MARCGLNDRAYQRIVATATHSIHAVGCVKFDEKSNSTDRPKARRSLSIDDICLLVQTFFSNKEPGIRFVGHGWLFKAYEALHHAAPLGLHSVAWRMLGRSELGKKSWKALRIVKARMLYLATIRVARTTFSLEGPARLSTPKSTWRLYVKVFASIWDWEVLPPKLSIVSEA